MNEYKGLLVALMPRFPVIAHDHAEASPAPVPDPSREEMILFQEIPSVFGASKYEQESSEAPASITVISAEEILRTGYRILAETPGGPRS